MFPHSKLFFLSKSSTNPWCWDFHQADLVDPWIFVWSKVSKLSHTFLTRATLFLFYRFHFHLSACHPNIDLRSWATQFVNRSWLHSPPTASTTLFRHRHHGCAQLADLTSPGAIPLRRKLALSTTCHPCADWPTRFTMRAHSCSPPTHKTLYPPPPYIPPRTVLKQPTPPP